MNGPSLGVPSRGLAPRRSNPSDVIFYTIANALYFPGLVALVNSLRRTGHDHDVVVLDAGLTEAQRDLLRLHCRLLPALEDDYVNASVFKAYAPVTLGHRGVAAVIDSDCIVSSSLEGVFQLARQGRICAHPDPEFDRWFPEWRDIFDTRKALRHQTYVNANFVVVSTVRWPGFLDRWWSTSRRVLNEPSVAEGANGAASQIDQDALNALLMSEYPSEALHLLPLEERLMSPEMRWAKVNNRTLSCRHAGHDVTLLHFEGRPKPWEMAAVSRVRRDAYVRLMRRLLWSADVAIPFPTQEPLPPWLRGGRRARLLLLVLDVVNYVRSISILSRPIRLLGRKLPKRMRARIIRLIYGRTPTTPAGSSRSLARPPERGVSGVAHDIAE